MDTQHALADGNHRTAVSGPRLAETAAPMVSANLQKMPRISAAKKNGDSETESPFIVGDAGLEPATSSM